VDRCGRGKIIGKGANDGTLALSCIGTMTGWHENVTWKLRRDCSGRSSGGKSA
jgi:hypothetical protein